MDMTKLGTHRNVKINFSKGLYVYLSMVFLYSHDWLVVGWSLLHAFWYLLFYSTVLRL